jgi:predicted ester cyclase
MNTDANKELIRRFYDEVWARGNVAFTDEVFADDYVRHDLRPTKAAPGPMGQALIAEQFRHAFPDLEWRVDLVLSEGELVAARWSASGTHSGSWGDVAPTGRKVTFSGVNIFRFGDNGKVVEIWNHRDDFGLAEQLGVQIFAAAQPQSEA